MNTVLRVANLAVRAALLVIVAFITFKHPWPGAWKGAVAVAAVTAATVQLVLWAHADLAAPARLRYAFLLPYALAAVTVTCDMAAAGPIGGELMVLAVLAALMAGSDTSLAAGLIVVGAGILACEVMGLFFGATVTTTLEHPAILLIAWMVGYNLRARQAQVEQSAALLAKADQLREEQAKVAALDERARIAREIHDVLAHSLGALGIQIQAARSVLHKDADQANDLLAAAQQMAAEGLVETRRAVQALRTDTLPLDEELALITDTHAQRYHVPVSYDTGGVLAALPPDATLALLRIAQEALVNAAKHAAGQPVAVRLDYGDADVRLTVRNDLPPGADTRQPADVSTVNGGYGLTGMHERLRLLNGTLEAGRRDGQWIVTAQLPRRQPEIMAS